MGKRAVFLDRDGTVLKHVELLFKPEDARFLPGAPAAIKKLNGLGFLTVVVTNEPVIARGIASEADVKKLHEAVNARLKKHGARIDAFYFCPHHPEATLPEYRKKCLCRKPGPGLILRAIKKYGINPKKSFTIGDALIDVVSGKRAGTKTILVKSGPGHARLDSLYADVKPDYSAKDLKSAVTLIGKIA